MALRLTIALDQANRVPNSDDLVHEWMQEGYFEIASALYDKESPKRVRAFPSVLSMQDAEGLHYGRCYILFYDHARQTLLFDRSGEYRVRFIESPEIISDWLTLRIVEPSEDLTTAIDLLSDPNDYWFLEFGDRLTGSDSESTIARLRRISDDYPRTVLGRWSAARLGLELFEQLQKKHPSFQKFRREQRTGDVEPLLAQTVNYLQKATMLSDDFEIRERVLYQLALAEYLNGDFERARVSLNELKTKYPHGVFGRRADRAEEELNRVDAQK